MFQAPKANWELRFASKRLLASDFEALEVSGAPGGDQESPKKLPKKPQEAPTRSPGGALGALWGPGSTQKSPRPTILETFIVVRVSNRFPGGPQVTIHGVDGVIMSRQGAAGSPQRGLKELLESQNEVQSRPEELHRGLEELRERS